MSNNLKVQLNRSGIRSLLMSQWAKGLCEDAAKLKKEDSKDEVLTYIGTKRARAVVYRGEKKNDRNADD